MERMQEAFWRCEKQPHSCASWAYHVNSTSPAQPQTRTSSSTLNLFAPGTTTKPPTIVSLMPAQSFQLHTMKFAINFYAISLSYTSALTQKYARQNIMLVLLSLLEILTFLFTESFSSIDACSMISCVLFPQAGLAEAFTFSVNCFLSILLVLQLFKHSFIFCSLWNV